MRSLRFSMHFRVVVLLFIVCGIVVLLPAASCAQASPEQTLTTFYKWYLHEFSLEHTPRPTSSKVDAVVSSRLRKWFKSKEGREWDADYFIDAQDWDPKWETHIKTTT